MKAQLRAPVAPSSAPSDDPEDITSASPLGNVAQTRHLRKKGEPAHMPRTHDVEVAVVERSQLRQPKAFRESNEAGVRATEVQVGVPLTSSALRSRSSAVTSTKRKKPVPNERRNAASTPAPASRSKR